MTEEFNYLLPRDLLILGPLHWDIQGSARKLKVRLGRSLLGTANDPQSWNRYVYVRKRSKQIWILVVEDGFPVDKPILIIVGLRFRIPLGPLALPIPISTRKPPNRNATNALRRQQWNRLAHAFTCNQPT
jgi:hypothetical protein